MEKKYVKPEMVIFEIGMGELMLSMSNDNYADPNAGGRAKGREEIWEEGTDLWGNDCWTRVE